MGAMKNLIGEKQIAKKKKTVWQFRKKLSTFKIKLYLYFHYLTLIMYLV